MREFSQQRLEGEALEASGTAVQRPGESSTGLAVEQSGGQTDQSGMVRGERRRS